MKKEQQKKSIIFFWLLLTVSIVMSTFLYNYKFELFDYIMNYSMLTSPIIVFSINQMFFRGGAIKPLFCIIITFFVQGLIFAGTKYLTDTIISDSYIWGVLISFVISALLIMILNKTLVKENTPNFLKIFLVYLFSLVLYSIIFEIILNNGLPSDFFIVLVFSNLIRLLISVVLSFIEFSIIRRNV